MTPSDLLAEIDSERQRLGMSKAALAEAVGTQAPAVRRLLTTDANPTLDTLSALASAVGKRVTLVNVDATPINTFEPTEMTVDLPSGPYATILADPPWRFMNRTGKVAPEHRRLSRYDTMTAAEIADLPVDPISADKAHLYLWVPNALVADGLAVMKAWGFTYKANIVWAKRRKDGGPDGRGVGFYFRNVTELLLFGAKGNLRTLGPGRRQVNIIETRKREHSRKPDEQYKVIEACSPGPYLELFARYARDGWDVWGLEAEDSVAPRGRQYPAYR